MDYLSVQPIQDKPMTDDKMNKSSNTLLPCFGDSDQQLSTLHQTEEEVQDNKGEEDPELSATNQVQRRLSSM